MRKSNNYRKRNKEKKQRKENLKKNKQIRLRVITLQGAIEKISILLRRLKCEVTVKITQNPNLILCSMN